jgi:hypothetical protein
MRPVVGQWQPTTAPSVSTAMMNRFGRRTMIPVERGSAK